MELAFLASLLGGKAAPATRVAAVEAALNSPKGGRLREELGQMVVHVLPAENVVPQVYAAWRPLVRDAMIFMITHLSTPRLAPKLVEQLDLPPDTTPEARLLRLISKVPALQKIGQVLARNPHLDPALRSALTDLEDGIADVRPEEIVAVIRKQLGRRLAKHDVQIEPDILAEASVSAVVRFTWRDSTTGERSRGVLKVLKPYVATCFAEDLELLQQLAHFLADKYPGHGRALPDTIMEVRSLLQHEVEFRREQATLAEAALMYKSVRGVRVPRLIQPLSTPTITALTEEDGVKVTSALAGAPSGERRHAAQQLIEALIAVPLLANNEGGMFHADPHAGNVLYDRGTGELVLLDWALTERLSSGQRQHMALLAIMLGLRDPVGVCDEIEALAVDRPLSPEHASFLRSHVNEFIGQLPFTRLPGSMDAMRLLDRLALEGIRFPAGLMMFRKVLFTLDGILHDIDAPDVKMDMTIARHMLGRWVGNLSFFDWIGIESSALLYAWRVGVQWADAALQRGANGSGGAAGFACLR